MEDYFDKDIQNIIRRAAWLGNDYAHYEFKHPGTDIEDLKKWTSAIQKMN